MLNMLYLNINLKLIDVVSIVFVQVQVELTYD